MHFDDIARLFRTKPLFQRLVLAFTVGLFISCAASANDGQTAADPSAVEAGR